MPDNQAYFNGDFYQALATTDLGQSPASAPEKWSRIRILSKWRFALTRLTYAHLLSLDGQTDKANIERSIAYGRDKLGLDDLIRAEAVAEENNLDQSRGLEFAHPPTSGNNGVIKASVVFDDVYRLIGWDADQIDDRDFNDARSCFSQALQEIWESWWWRQAMQCARLQFATTLDSTANYSAGQTAYDPAADVYLTALRDCTGADTDSFEEYDPKEPANLPAWDGTADYSAGDQFSYAGTDYQCWTDFETGDGGLAFSGAGSSEANGTYTQVTAEQWVHSDGEHTLTYIGGDGVWWLYNAGAVTLYYCLPENFPFGPWVPATGDAPAPTVESAPPTDKDFFVPLQGWRPLLPWTNYGGVQQEPFGPIRSVSKFDPRISCNAQQFQLDVRGDGTRVREMSETHPWVWARRVTPIITGAEWSASENYEAVDPSELVFGTTDDSFLEVEGGFLRVFV